MAVTPTSVTQNLTSPILEGSLTAFLKTLEPLIGQKVDTSVYAPKIAAESALQQQARTAAGGLGSLIGPDAYKQYMSPYQQEVIDTTLSEYDRQAAIQRQGIGQSAIQSGAFGGGREGVARPCCSGNWSHRKTEDDLFHARSAKDAKWTNHAQTVARC